MPASSRAKETPGTKAAGKGTSGANGENTADKEAGASRGKGGSKGVKADDRIQRDVGRGKKTLGPILIQLEHARWRHFGWATFCMVVGGLLLLKLGTVGQGFGLFLIGLAIYRGYRFAKTLLLPAGTIEITTSHVELPLGLCNGKSERIAIDEVAHVFLLRRAVSWTTSGPVLIIEAGARAYSYPRDWFESETDQRKILQRLLEHRKNDKRKNDKNGAKANGAKANGAKPAPQQKTGQSSTSES